MAICGCCLPLLRSIEGIAASSVRVLSRLIGEAWIEAGQTSVSPCHVLQNRAGEGSQQPALELALGYETRTTGDKYAKQSFLVQKM